MKVLFVHELFPPWISGGGEIHCKNIVLGLKEKSIDIRVVAGAWEKNKFDTYKSVPVYRVNLSPTRYSFNLKAFFGLKKMVKKFKPAIIHANTYHSAIPASLISKTFNIPIVLSVHSLFLEEWFRYLNPITSYLFYLFERIIYSFPYDKILVDSYNEYYCLCRLGLKKKLLINEHPIDVSLFKPRRKKKKKIVIGATATGYQRTQRDFIFLSLAEKLKKKYDFEFLMVGNYDRNKLKDNVKFIDTVPHTEMPKYYNKMDIFIGQGASVREAMACGCVAILNESTERLLRFHKKEIDAGLMLHGDHEKIIEQLLSNPKEFKTLSKKSVGFIRKTYPAEKIISEIIKVYKELI